MEAFLSPSYSHEKLENPDFSDLVDVFEDCWRNYIFAQTHLLLRTPHGDIAAMSVLSSYFEAIASYIYGVNTNGQSIKYFVKGFCKIFTSSSPEIEKAAKAIYKHIRCGLAHDGMLSHKVNYSRAGSKPFFLTYRKKSDGTLDLEVGVVSIVVNPVLLYEGVIQHFNNYISSLREGKDAVLLAAFKKTFTHQSAIGKGENIVGMTEAEFLGRT